MVVLGSHSKEELLKTHSRYFRSAREILENAQVSLRLLRVATRYHGKWLTFCSTPGGDLRRSTPATHPDSPRFLRYAPSGHIPSAALRLVQVMTPRRGVSG